MSVGKFFVSFEYNHKASNGLMDIINQKKMMKNVKTCKEIFSNNGFK